MNSLRKFYFKLSVVNEYLELPSILVTQKQKEDYQQLDSSMECLSHYLQSYKNLIEVQSIQKEWNFYKKRANNFELIFTNQYNTSNISKYQPCSRSYYKLLEILKDLNLLSNQTFMRTAHIAEGPGGFVECFQNLRGKINKQDHSYVLTLRDGTKSCPSWSDFVTSKKNITICWGHDKTGNLYNVKNIINFRNQVKYASLVTADGGFDISQDYNNQELYTYRLIFCEIVCALSIQEKGGTFIVKMFDFFHQQTQTLLWLLCNLYKNVYITKPFTSRSANSEKYVICHQFKGISDSYLHKLLTAVSIMGKTDTSFYDVFSNYSPPTLFKDCLQSYLVHNVQEQVKTIITTILLIKQSQLTKQNDKQFLEYQILNAIDWCKKYNQPIYYKYNQINKQNRWR